MCIRDRGWTEAIWALSDALTAKKRSLREEREQAAAQLLSQQAEGNGTNAAAWYAAIQIWEMYLRCRRGRDSQQAAQALRNYAQLLTPVSYTHLDVYKRQARSLFR